MAFSAEASFLEKIIKTIWFKQARTRDYFEKYICYVKMFNSNTDWCWMVGGFTVSQVFTIGVIPKIYLLLRRLDLI